jgi:hypothetical protein
MHDFVDPKYPLRNEYDPDFDKPHPYTKSNGDGSPRGYCRCERLREDPIHLQPKEVAHSSPT